MSKPIVWGFLLILTSNCVNAVPVNYFESASGDLSNVRSSYLNFEFDIGINTISGSWGALLGLPVNDRDGFSFTVPDGTELTNILYELNDPVVSMRGENLLASTFTLLESDPLNLIARENVLLPTDDTQQILFSDNAPLSANTYLLDQNNSFLLIDPVFPILENDGGFIPYTWSFTIEALDLTDAPPLSPVPVPPAVWLFGSALIGLVGFSKRRKTV